MARRVLSSPRAAALCLGLAALACNRHHPTPTPAPAPADSSAENAQKARFAVELGRAHTLWQERPELGKCLDSLKEKPDADLCRAASSALGGVEQLDPAAPPSAALAVLADAALALVRLVERARYLSLEELGRARVEGDAGAPGHAAGARPYVGAAPTASAAARSDPAHSVQNLLRERPRLKITETPLTLLVQVAARLERGVLRNLGAYLEYAPLPVRQAACETLKELQSEHAQWPALNHLLREAAVLETDATLKQRESELASLGFPRGKHPNQPTGSK